MDIALIRMKASLLWLAFLRRSDSDTSDGFFWTLTGEQLTVTLLTMRARMHSPNGSLSLSGAQLHFQIAILFPDVI